jgi:hypothetical protein
MNDHEKMMKVVISAIYDVEKITEEINPGNYLFRKKV